MTQDGTRVTILHDNFTYAEVVKGGVRVHDGRIAELPEGSAAKLNHVACAPIDKGDGTRMFVEIREDGAPGWWFIAGRAHPPRAPRYETHHKR